MKRILLLIFVSLMLTCAKAQSAYQYVSFPDSGAVWVSQNACYFIDIGSVIEHSIVLSRIFLSGVSHDNSLPSGGTYRTLMAVNLHSDPYQPFYTDSSLLGYIREDTLAKKIYLRRANGNTDILLYNFSLNIGDTLDTYHSNGFRAQVAQAIIRRIDTVTYNGSQRKRFVFDCVDDTGRVVIDTSRTLAIIEGIGSEGGLLNDLSANEVTTDPCRFALECFSYRDTIIYPTYSIGECAFFLPEGINEPTISDIKVSPNPASNQLHLSFTDAGRYNTQLILSDILGQEVYSSPIIGSESTHDISKLWSGIYTWRLVQNNAIIKTGKIIKQ